MLRPAPLRKGDPVSVVAPASPFDRASFDRGLALLSGRYRPSVDPSIFETQRYLAGSDERRLRELNGALASPETRAIFCARGGYGLHRILAQVKLPQRPKLLVGFSDITVLHAAAQVAGWVSVHGPVLTQLGNHGEAAANALFEVLEKPEHRVELAGKPLVSGTCEGPVVGGNLSILTRLLGTPFMPPLDGAILLLEDVTERPYRLDRMWHHLALAGVFSRVAGLALGDLTECDEPNGTWTGREVLFELARAAGLPCVVDVPVGHGAVNRALPLGARATLDGAAGTLRFLEGAVQ